MTARGMTEQRLKRRDAWAFRPFVALCATTAALLAYEIVKQNQARDVIERWPDFLGVPTTASLFVASLGFLVARAQYARSLKPLLRCVSQWGTSTERALLSPADRYRSVWIRNVGPGAATVNGVRWTLASAGGNEDLTSIGSLHDALAKLGLREGHDYSIANYSPGTALASGEQRLYLECTEAAVSRLTVLDAVFDIESLLGDEYERRMPLLPVPGATSAAVALPKDSATA